MAGVPVADNDVLDLNVGGALLTTKRATMTQVINSFFSCQQLPHLQAAAAEQRPAITSASQSIVLECR